MSVTMSYSSRVSLQWKRPGKSKSSKNISKNKIRLSNLENLMPTSLIFYTAIWWIIQIDFLLEPAQPPKLAMELSSHSMSLTWMTQMSVIKHSTQIWRTQQLKTTISRSSRSDFSSRLRLLAMTHSSISLMISICMMQNKMMMVKCKITDHIKKSKKRTSISSYWSKTARE